MTTDSGSDSGITTNKSEYKFIHTISYITEQHALLSFQLNIVTCPTNPEKCCCAVFTIFAVNHPVVKGIKVSYQ